MSRRQLDAGSSGQIEQCVRCPDEALPGPREQPVHPGRLVTIHGNGAAEIEVVAAHAQPAGVWLPGLRPDLAVVRRAADCRIALLKPTRVDECITGPDGFPF